MKKLSTLCESLWADVQSQAAGEQVKEEDRPWVSFELDGNKYIFSKYAKELSDKFFEDNDDDGWNCFGFNKPSEGIIVNEVKFSYKNYDFDEDNYDVYVLRDFFDMSKKNRWIFRKDYIYDQIVKNGYIESMPIPEIKEILLDFTRRIFDENRLSEYAAYQIFSLMSSDYGDNYAIYVSVDSDYTPDDTEFPEEYIEDEHSILYPTFDGWSDDLEKALIDAYEKLGWTKSEEHQLDPYDSPSYTESLVFVKLKEGYVPGENEDEDDEEDDEY